MKTHRVLAIAGLICLAGLSLPAAGIDAGQPSLTVDLASPTTIHQETSNSVAGEPCMSMLNFERSFDMSVIAKVRCTHKSLHPHQQADGTTVNAASLRFAAVQATDGKDYQQRLEENKIFGTHTPSLDLSTYIVNPGAHEQFEVDEEYYLRFEKAPTREHGPTKAPTGST